MDFVAIILHTKINASLRKKYKKLLGSQPIPECLIQNILAYIGLPYFRPDLGLEFISRKRFREDSLSIAETSEPSSSASSASAERRDTL